METYDEWRLILEVATSERANRVVKKARAHVPDDVHLHTRGDQVLVYGHTEEATTLAGDGVSEILTELGVAPNATLTRWNPGTEEWQEPSLPVDPPRHDISPEWAALGELGWEVRVRSQDRREARSLAEELLAAGRPTIDYRPTKPHHRRRRGRRGGIDLGGRGSPSGADSADHDPAALALAPVADPPAAPRKLRERWWRRQRGRSRGRWR